MEFFISDTHFGHANIIKYSNRPFSSVQEMDRTLIENWNHVVGPKDHVYHLGDFAFAPRDRIAYILSQLNGIKHFIMGNHDNIIKNNKKFFLENKLWDSIDTDVELKCSNGAFLILHHYGKRVWNKSHHGSIHLYGHSHGTLPPYNKSVDVGVDAPFITGVPTYTPYSLKQITDYMNTRIAEKVDHHG